MIIDTLIPSLRESFGAAAFRVEGSAPEVVFPAKHPDFGDVVIRDDGDELTVYVGRFTHGHFSNYDDVTGAEKEARIVEATIAFLHKLFADRIVAWGSHAGVGGYYARGGRPLMILAIGRGVEYVWSGPIG